jgi:hypothetical protein
MVKISKGRLVSGRGGALILLVILGGINRIASKDQYVSPHKSPSYEKSIDSAVSMLQQGDLLLRRSKDITSYMLSEANPSDKRFSHCGLVQIENREAVVYHFIGGETKNGMKREPARHFLSPVYNNAAGIARYPLNDAESARQSDLIRQYYRLQMPFDYQFDLLSDSSLYCAEFICKLMNTVKMDSLFIEPTLKKGLAYIPVENLYNNGKAGLIWQMSFK